MSHPKPLNDDLQLNLFHPRPTVPRWSQLPTGIREATCELLAEMLIDYCTRRAQSSQQKETTDE